MMNFQLEQKEGYKDKQPGQSIESTIKYQNENIILRDEGEGYFTKISIDHLIKDKKVTFGIISDQPMKSKLQLVKSRISQGKYKIKQDKDKKQYTICINYDVNNIISDKVIIHILLQKCKRIVLPNRMNHKDLIDLTFKWKVKKQKIIYLSEKYPHLTNNYIENLIDRADINGGTLNVHSGKYIEIEFIGFCTKIISSGGGCSLWRCPIVQKIKMWDCCPYFKPGNGFDNRRNINREFLCLSIHLTEEEYKKQKEKPCDCKATNKCFSCMNNQNIYIKMDLSNNRQIANTYVKLPSNNKKISLYPFAYGYSRIPSFSVCGCQSYPLCLFSDFVHIIKSQSFNFMVICGDFTCMKFIPKINPNKWIKSFHDPDPTSYCWKAKKINLKKESTKIEVVI